MRAPTLIALVLALAGCGGGGGNASPEEAFKTYDQAMRKGDLDAMWELQSERAQKMMGDMLEQDLLTLSPEEFAAEFGFPQTEIRGKSPKQAFARMAQSDKARQAAAEKAKPVIDKVERDGAQATLYFKDGDADCRVSMIEESNGWKIDGLVACRKEAVKPAPPRAEPAPGPRPVDPLPPPAP